MPAVPRAVCIGPGRIIVDHAGANHPQSDLVLLEQALRTPLNRLATHEGAVVDAVVRRLLDRESDSGGAVPVAAFTSSI